MGKSKAISTQGFKPDSVPKILYAGQQIIQNTTNLGRAIPNYKINFNKENYHQLFEVSPFPMLVYDRDTFNILAVNKQAEIVYGYSQAEFQELLLSDLAVSNTYDYQDFQFEYLDQNSTYLHQTKDGKRLEVEVKISKIYFENRASYLIAVIDQTEKLKAKRALERLTGRFKQIFETALIGITMTRSDGEVIEANDAFLEMVGYSRQDFNDKLLNWIDLTPPEWRYIDSLAGLEIEQNGYCEPYEKEYIRKDGTRIPVLLHLSAVKGDKGYFSCFILDLTELKEANRSVVESESNLKAIINSGSEGYILLDKEWKIIAYNNMVEKWIKEMTGKQILTGEYLVDYIIKEALDEYIYQIEKAYSGETVIFSKKLYNSNLWFQYQITPIFSGNQVKSVCMYITDITNERANAEVIRLNEEKFRSLVQNSSDIIAILDSKGVVQYVSDSITKILGYSVDDFLGKNVMDLIHPQDLPKVRKRWLNRLKKPDSPTRGFIHRIKHANGTWRYIETAGNNLLHNSSINGIVINSRDVTERKLTEQELLESRQFIQQIANSTPNIIYLYDIKHAKTMYVNEAVTNLLDVSTAEILKKEPEIWKKLIHPEHEDPLKNKVKTKYSSIQQKDRLISEVEFRFKDKRGHWRWLLSQQVLFNTTKKGEPLQLVGTIEDITERRKMEDKLIRDAFYDDLTDLPNRNLFVEKLDEALSLTKSFKDKKLAVLFVDLDRFKIVNDSLGHTIGDKLLVAIAKRLKRSVRSKDFVARMGGDEFTILLYDFNSVEDVTRIADKIQDELAQPFKLDRYEVYVTPSIGIALSDVGYENAEDLLRDADTAMYRAKSQGRGRYEIFDKKMHTKVLELLKMEADLRRAMDRKEFQLHYHPIVSLETNQVIGCEALIRWNHPEKGLIYPSEFIGLAEETGLILRIDRWALYTATLQNKLWQMAGLPEVQVSVNLSTHQLKQRNLTQVISKVLSETKLEPRFLKLELTETVVMENSEIAINTLNEVRKMGVSLAVDDFGTGYSSLIYLKQLPIDSLKIDQSFIKDIIYDTDSASIAKAIISLAHNLGLNVVAEGVENTEQLSFLRLQNCDAIQGYLLSSPLTADEFAEFLEKQRKVDLPEL